MPWDIYVNTPEEIEGIRLGILHLCTQSDPAWEPSIPLLLSPHALWHFSLPIRFLPLHKPYVGNQTAARAAREVLDLAGQAVRRLLHFLPTLYALLL